MIKRTIDNYFPYAQEILFHIGECVLMLFHAFCYAFTQKQKRATILDQLYSIGVSSLPVVAITGFSTGMVLAAQSFFQLSDKGLTEATGIMVAKAMLTELGPVLTAFMITGRVGASMCAELGSMKVTEQIDALKSFSINPIAFLVTPRLLAGLIAVPLLTLFSNAMGIFGSYLVAVKVFSMVPATFFNPIPIYLSRFDLFSGLFKSVIFGVIIITISCYKGLTTHGGAQGVGRSTTQSVVIAYSIILISNFLLTLALNLTYYWLWL